jgi:hypothetical protein
MRLFFADEGAAGEEVAIRQDDRSYVYQLAVSADASPRLTRCPRRNRSAHVSNVRDTAK